MLRFCCFASTVEIHLRLWLANSLLSNWVKKLIKSNANFSSHTVFPRCWRPYGFCGLDFLTRGAGLFWQETVAKHAARVAGQRDVERFLHKGLKVPGKSRNVDIIKIWKFQGPRATWGFKSSKIERACFLEQLAYLLEVHQSWCFHMGLFCY